MRETDRKKWFWIICVNSALLLDRLLANVHVGGVNNYNLYNNEYMI